MFLNDEYPPAGLFKPDMFIEQFDALGPNETIACPNPGSLKVRLGVGGLLCEPEVVILSKNSDPVIPTVSARVFSHGEVVGCAAMNEITLGICSTVWEMPPATSDDAAALAALLVLSDVAEIVRDNGLLGHAA